MSGNPRMVESSTSFWDSLQEDHQCPREIHMPSNSSDWGEIVNNGLKGFSEFPGLSIGRWMDLQMYQETWINFADKIERKLSECLGYVDWEYKALYFLVDWSMIHDCWDNYLWFLTKLHLEKALIVHSVHKSATWEGLRWHLFFTPYSVNWGGSSGATGSTVSVAPNGTWMLVLDWWLTWAYQPDDSFPFLLELLGLGLPPVDGSWVLRMSILRSRSES